MDHVGELAADLWLSKGNISSDTQSGRAAEESWFTEDPLCYLNAVAAMRLRPLALGLQIHRSTGPGDRGGVNVARLPRKPMMRDARLSRRDGFVWHSQMTRTDHPSSFS